MRPKIPDSQENSVKVEALTRIVMMFVLVKDLTSVKWLFDYSRHDWCV